MASLVASGASPEPLVTFTFSDKAAETIKDGMAKSLTVCGLDPLLACGMYIGTIHAWCRRVLGDMDAKYRQFDVLDTTQLQMYQVSRYSKLAIMPSAHPVQHQDG